MSRYHSFANLIAAGGYRLADIKERICGIADRGEVTLEERDRLLKLAQEHADPLCETDKGAKLMELEARLRAVEARLAALEDGANEPENGEETEEPEEYAAGKWYYAGDVVRWKDKAYECIAPEGVVCVWSPEEYPEHWKEMA